MFQVESPADPLEKSTEVVEDRGLSERIIAQVKSRATLPWFAPWCPIDLFLLEMSSPHEGAREMALLPSLSRDPKGFQNPLGLRLAY